MTNRPLKLNGKALDLNPPRPAEIKLKTLLDKAPPDELYTPTELSRKSGMARSTIVDLGSLADARYTVRIGRDRYWGNPKAIAELLKQVNRES